jgi:hypothetical protein
MKKNLLYLLRFIDGPMASRQFTLTPGETYIVGSHSDADIRIDGDPTVSRRHAAVFLTDNGKLNVTDLNSTNGIKINRKKIKREGKLKEGDALQFGGHTICIVQPWAALESSLPPKMVEHFHLIPKSPFIKMTTFKLMTPLWSTVSGFFIGGLIFSLWQVWDFPHHVFAKTPQQVFRPSEEKVKGEVSLVASHYVWDEITRICKIFGEPAPLRSDEQLLTSVEQWINIYTKNRRHLELIERRDVVWEQVKSIFKHYSLPAELGYLAWIESEFDPNADQGNIATAEALRSVLNQLSKPNILLAVAAFASRQNQMKQQELIASINASNNTNFWTFKDALPSETIDYVSKVLAAIIVGSNPDNW